MEMESWKTQMKKGMLEYCILLILETEPSYGYMILSKLNSFDIIATTESTVYPLLRRLQKEGYLQSNWQESQEGIPPRKYYSLTTLGIDFLRAMENEWNELKEAVTVIEKEGKE